ncbi:hypothetical protein V1524DRAFT_450381 [Lipomyces starkeyi]
MEEPHVTVIDSKYCQNCAACRTLVRCDTLQELQQMYSGRDGHAFKTCRKCGEQGEVLKRAGFDLDGCYDTHEEFVEAVSSFVEPHDNHAFDASQTTFTLSCARSNEWKLERDPSRVERYTVSKEVFDCQGELRITLSKVYESITIVYEHKGHIETHKLHMTEEVRSYIRAQNRLAPRQIYQNLIQVAKEPEFEKTDLHTITRQQVDAANDFRSAQLLVAEQLDSKPGVSSFVTPCFTNQEKYKRAKMTEVFVDSTVGTNKHGYELYCVLTEYDLVSVPLSYLLLDTRGRRLTQWFAPLRNAGLKPKTVHTDKDFAGSTLIS